MSTMLPPRVTRRLPSAYLLIVLALVVSVPREAQASPCKTLLASAQEHYVEQRFADAEAAVRSCLGRSYVAPEDALASHRLLALLHLRQDQLVEAKRAVLQLLSVDFDYAPDPISDPPPFSALIETVRGQLRVDSADTPCACAPSSEDDSAAGEDAVPVASVAAAGAEAVPAPLASLRSNRSVHLGLSMGGGSYSGERGINAPTLLGEFGQNGGIMLALDGTYYLTNTLAVAAQLHAVRIPLLFSNDVRHEDVHVRPEDSSEWVHALTILARTFYRSQGRATPYFHLGLGGVMSRLNQRVRIAVAPQVGAGVDVAATPRLAAFAELNLLVAIPGDAVDRVDTSDGPGDMLTFAGVGLRYRLGVW